MVVRKILIHQLAPSADKLPLEVAERESNLVTFNALNPADYKQDFQCLFHYDVGNVVAFIFVSIHRQKGAKDSYSMRTMQKL